jgi:outer membrane receptor protein involved in Fe transport
MEAEEPAGDPTVNWGMSREVELQSSSACGGRRMKSNHKLSRTIAAILSATAAHVVLAADAASVGPAAPVAADAASTATLQQVIVTAQRRTENAQNVPITIQVLTGQTLQQLNVQTLGDYLKYVPNVTNGSLGAGNDIVTMRGLSSTNEDPEGQGSVGPFPNVATYLDDQSTLLPARNLDVYAVDLERVEIDEGPQMFFGAGAEAGVIRYITNKPRLDTMSVDVNASYGTTAHGDPNNSESAVLNAPLIEGKLAGRLVMFIDRRGGYINNLPATFARNSTDLGLADENGGIVPQSPTINNYNQTGNAINPLTYQGVRGELLYKVNDDWNAVLSVMTQNMDAEGVFYDMPYGTEGEETNDVTGAPVGTVALPALSVNLFNPSYDKDKFIDTALTVNGKVGPLSLVYSGSYLDRNVDQTQDLTSYARGRFGYYYQCAGVSYSATAGNANATCASPSSYWNETERNTNVQQELRLSTPDSWRLRGLMGIFYGDLNIWDDTAWSYKTVPNCAPGGPTSNCFLTVQSWPGAPAYIYGDRPSVGFFDDFKRVVKQRAAYVSSSFDIIPNTLTISGGIRYFDMYDSETGGDVGSFYCKIFSASQLADVPIVNGNYAPCGTDGQPDGASSPYGTDFNNQIHTLVQTGHLGRGNLTWHITPQAMVYYTYSQGYRPGGFNRGSSAEEPDAKGIPQYLTPLAYNSDILTNQEIGWKTVWFDQRLMFNGSIYNDVWSDAQQEFFCPQCGFGNLIFAINGPKYRVRGTELQLALRPTRGLTVDASAAVNSGHQVNSPFLTDNNPASPNYGKPLTTRYVGGVATPIQNPYGPEGQDTALSPPFKWNVRARYDWPVASYIWFVQGGLQHQAQSISSTTYFTGFRMPSWTTVDASAGVSEGNWTVSLNGSNLTNVTKSQFTTDTEIILTETPMRPRVISLNFGYSWAQHE